MAKLLKKRHFFNQFTSNIDFDVGLCTYISHSSKLFKGYPRFCIFIGPTSRPMSESDDLNSYLFHAYQK